MNQSNVVIYGAQHMRNQLLEGQWGLWLNLCWLSCFQKTELMKVLQLPTSDPKLGLLLPNTDSESVVLLSTTVPQIPTIKVTVMPIFGGLAWPALFL